MTAASAFAGAPPELRAFLEQHRSVEAAWSACPRADWLLWLARRGALDDASKRALVRAAARAASVSGGKIRRTHDARVADAWGSSDGEIDDPTGFRALVIGAVVAAVVAIPVDVYLYFHPDAAGGALAGLRRELVTIPLFVVVALVVRVVARPLLARSWAHAVSAYSFERAERELFPRLERAVAEANDAERRIQVDLFRRQFVPAAR